MIILKYMNAENTVITKYDGNHANVYMSGQDGFAELEAQNPEPYEPPIIDTLAEERSKMTCTRLQARLALGVARCTQLDAMADDAATPWAVAETIKNAATWYRTHPDMDVIGWALGYEPEEIDDLFRLAMTL